ncbi:MAG TPA: DUF2147 domain-containing protein [Steroidobacteraceae bacterium]|nr:DUF2147 domain-containing protein [Steroidobacteraceae bacterium]
MTNKLNSVTLALTLGLLAFARCGVAADDMASRVLGNWLTEPKTGIIQVTQRPDGKFEGRIVGGTTPTRLDEKNPDQARRALLLKGQLILHDMGYDGQGAWSGGTIYDPDSGRTYKALMQLNADGTLKVRGYIGFSLLGRNELWTRYTGTALDLPPGH